MPRYVQAHLFLQVVASTWTTFWVRSMRNPQQWSPFPYAVSFQTKLLPCADTTGISIPTLYLGCFPNGIQWTCRFWGSCNCLLQNIDPFGPSASLWCSVSHGWRSWQVPVLLVLPFLCRSWRGLIWVASCWELLYVCCRKTSHWCRGWW